MAEELKIKIPKSNENEIAIIPQGETGMKSGDHFGFQHVDKLLKALGERAKTAIISLMSVGFILVFWGGELENWIDLVRYFSPFFIILIFFELRKFCKNNKNFWLYAFWYLIMLVLVFLLIVHWKNIILLQHHGE